MAYLSPSSRRDLVELAARYRTCTACKLHKVRRRTFDGVGNDRATVVFVLDRLFSDEVLNHQFFVKSQYEFVLQYIMDSIGKSIGDYWYTPVVLCPTAIPEPRSVDVLPAPKHADVKACSSRLLSEINCIDPEVVVALGQQSIRAFFPSETPSAQYNLGEMREAMVPGEHVHYPVPVMFTHSLQTLLTRQDFSRGGLWQKTCSHIATAIDIAEFLRNENEEVHQADPKSPPR